MPIQPLKARAMKLAIERIDRERGTLKQLEDQNEMLRTLIKKHDLQYEEKGAIKQVTQKIIRQWMSHVATHSSVTPHKIRLQELFLRGSAVVNPSYLRKISFKKQSKMVRSAVAESSSEEDDTKNEKQKKHDENDIDEAPKKVDEEIVESEHDKDRTEKEHNEVAESSRVPEVRVQVQEADDSHTFARRSSDAPAPSEVPVILQSPANGRSTQESQSRRVVTTPFKTMHTPDRSVHSSSAKKRKAATDCTLAQTKKPSKKRMTEEDAQYVPYAEGSSGQKQPQRDSHGQKPAQSALSEQNNLNLIGRMHMVGSDLQVLKANCTASSNEAAGKTTSVIKQPKPATSTSSKLLVEMSGLQAQDDEEPESALAKRLIRFSSNELNRELHNIWLFTQGLASDIVADQHRDPEKRPSLVLTPTEELRSWYVLLFGAAWEQGLLHADRKKSFKPSDMIGACIDAAIFRMVFEQPLPWTGPEKLLESLSEWTRLMNDILGYSGQGRIATVDFLVWQAAHDRANDAEFLATKIRPLARKLAARIFLVMAQLFAALDAAPSKDGSHDRQLVDIIEYALKLKLKTEAAPQYYEWRWFPSGTPFDDTNMSNLRASDPYKGRTEEHEVWLCKGPLVMVKSRKQDEWTAASKARIFVVLK